MKATDLRIGSYVTNKRIPAIRDYIVKQIHYDHLTPEYYLINGYCIAEYVPIPLTEEWLLKFGFEETYNSEFRKRLDHPCNFIGYDFSKTSDKSMEGFRYYGHYIECKYVHQLQNLYHALTGEELTIKES